MGTVVNVKLLVMIGDVMDSEKAVVDANGSFVLPKSWRDKFPKKEDELLGWIYHNRQERRLEVLPMAGIVDVLSAINDEMLTNPLFYQRVNKHVGPELCPLMSRNGWEVEVPDKFRDFNEVVLVGVNHMVKVFMQARH